MSDSADERRARFRALHEREQLFVMPNPWDIGSARLLASAGFEALATTSAGFAWSLGRLDQNVSRDELVAHVATLAAATDLPLNVDSERCYPDDPGGVTRTVELLAEAGAAGFSIEDYNPDTGDIDDVGLIVIGGLTSSVLRALARDEVRTIILLRHRRFTLRRARETNETKMAAH